MSDGPTAAALVPEIFYDLISRVVPGTILLPTLFFAWFGPSRFHSLLHTWWTQPADDRPSGLFLLTLYLFAAYATGVLLRGLYYLVVRDLTPNLRNKRRRNKHYIDYHTYYNIKLALPDAGSRLAKLKAEVSMTGVLEAGFCLAFTINGLRAAICDLGNRLFVGLFILMAIACTDAYRRHIRSRVGQAVTLHATILGIRETPPTDDLRQ